MGKASIAYTAMNYGYVSPRLRGRIDLDFFNQSLDYALNYKFTPQGEGSFREGSVFVSQTKDNKPARLVPFLYNTEQAYIIEMTDLFMRFYKDHGLITETPQNITSISQANPAVVEYAGTDTYANGDRVYLSGISGMTQLNGVEAIVANVNAGANTFELQGINSTGYDAYTSGGTVAEIVQLATPYTEAQLFDLDYTQTNNTMYVVHSAHQPRKLTRSSHTSWAINTFTFNGNPFGTTKTAAQTLSAATQASPVVVTYVGADTYANGDTVYIEGVKGMTQLNKKNFTVANVNVGANTFELLGVDGTIYDAYSSGGTVESFTAFSWPSRVTLYDGRLIYAASDDAPTTLFFSKAGELDNFTYGTLAADAIKYALRSDQANKILWLCAGESFLAIGTSGSEYRATGGGENDTITPTNISVKPASFNGVSNVRPIRLDSYILFGQRNKKTLRSLEYNALQDGYTAPDRTLLADHIGKSGFKQLTYTAGTPNNIWGVRFDGRLTGLTFDPAQQVVAWHLHATQGLYHSVATIPEAEGDDELWQCVKRTINGQVRYYVEYVPNVPDMPIPEEYFTDEENEVSDTAAYLTALWQTQKTLIHSDSSLIYDGRDLAAVSISVAGGTTSGDEVTVTAGAGFFTVMMEGRRLQTPEGGQIEITQYNNPTQVIGTVLYDLEATNFAAGQWFYMANGLAGLNHLEGVTVSILADGGVLTSQTVTNGRVQLDDFAGYVIVGMGYKGLGKSQSMEGGSQTGAAQTKPRTVTKLGVVMRASLGTKFGTSLYRLNEPAYRVINEVAGRPPALFDGPIDTITPDDWDEKKNLYWLHDKPTPSNIQLIIAHAETTD